MKAWRFNHLFGNEAMPACGKVAFHYGRDPTHEPVADSSAAYYPDGTQPAPGSRVICGSCRGGITMNNWRPDLAVEEEVPLP